MHFIRPRVYKKTGMVFALLCLLSLFDLFTPETVKAGVYDDAYTFYQTYGNEMSFQAGAKNQGEIYYATKAKKDENTGIKYTTIGWQVRVFNSSGALVETLYYQLGGEHMSLMSTRTVHGYEYCLYRVSLSNLKTRLSAAGLNALNNPDCNIVFDACTTTKLKGVVQGGMTDQGPSWGKVYTTYNEIVNAQKWSAATRKTLKSYYNKTVAGLFYDVNLEPGIGIAEVSGAGRYCFGTEVMIQAEVLEGHHFTGWSGREVSSNKSHSFVIYDQDVTYTANAAENSYTIVYNGKDGTGSIPSQEVLYSGTFITPTEGFVREESALAGWEVKTQRETYKFRKGEELLVRDLVQALEVQNMNKAVITLYASWDHGPFIATKEIFVSLADAQSGKITEDWLAQRAEAIDQEDGEIPYGQNEKTSFLLEDYSDSDFTDTTTDNGITKTFFAVDSAGNITRKEVLIHIVDDQIFPASRSLGRVRFISKQYFLNEDGGLLDESQGGLDENSIWRLNEEYRTLLEKLFM